MRRHVVFALVVFLFGALIVSCTTPTGGSPVSTEAPPVKTSGTPSTTTTTSPPVTTTQLSPAEQLLHEMDLSQKAAQVLLLAIDGTAVSPGTKGLLAEGPPAGVLLLQRNVTGAAQLTALTAALQQAAVAGGSGVGLFVAVDQEGGPVQRIHDGAPVVPAARSLGDGSSPEEAGLLAAETAAGLLALGVNMNLAPVADVVDDKASFLYRRAYAGDPAKVAEYVSAVTEGSARGGLIAVVKHFPGHGSAAADTHSGKAVSQAAAADFETIHLPPFQAAIEAGAEGVMVAHLVAAAYDPKRPASQSGEIVEGLLRGELGFAGLVVTDDLEMAGTGTAGSGEAGIAALQAGCDLLISTGTEAKQRELWEAIVNAVETGRLALSRLDQAVTRVLSLKLRHGLTTFQSQRPD